MPVPPASVGASRGPSAPERCFMNLLLVIGANYSFYSQLLFLSKKTGELFFLMLDPRRCNKRCLCPRFRVVMLASLLTVLQLRSDMPRVRPILIFICKLLEKTRNRAYDRHGEQTPQGLGCSQSPRGFLSEAQPLHLTLSSVDVPCMGHKVRHQHARRDQLHHQPGSFLLENTVQREAEEAVPGASLPYSVRTEPCRLSPVLLWLFAAHWKTTASHQRLS